MPPHRFTHVLAAFVVSALLPASAGAAQSATAVSIPCPGPALTITAGVGEQNEISVDLSKSEYVVRDLGNPVTAGKGCVVVERDTVTCGVLGFPQVEVWLGDLDDRFTSLADLRPVVDGGAGDNVLAGGPGSDTLIGAAGGDSVSGGPGWDTVSYADVWRQSH